MKRLASTGSRRKAPERKPEDNPLVHHLGSLLRVIECDAAPGRMRLTRFERNQVEAARVAFQEEGAKA